MTELSNKVLNVLRQKKSDEWTTQEELISAIEELGEFASLNSQSHDKCPKIWEIINEINLSSECDEIVIIKNFKYKIPTKEEAMQSQKQYWENRLLPMLNRFHIKNRKMKLNEQMNIFTEDITKVFKE